MSAGFSKIWNCVLHIFTFIRLIDVKIFHFYEKTHTFLHYTILQNKLTLKISNINKTIVNMVVNIGFKPQWIEHIVIQKNFNFTFLVDCLLDNYFNIEVQFFTRRKLSDF